MNEILSNLKPYPFEKLNKLLKEINTHRNISMELILVIMDF